VPDQVIKSQTTTLDRPDELCRPSGAEDLAGKVDGGGLVTRVDEALDLADHPLEGLLRLLAVLGQRDEALGHGHHGLVRVEAGLVEGTDEGCRLLEAEAQSLN